MKKILLLSILLVGLLSCDKDDEKTLSLVGTEWGAHVADFDEFGSADLLIQFVSENKVKYFIDDEPYIWTYSFNSETSKGYIFDSDDDPVAFSVNGNKLTMSDDEMSITFNKIK